MTSVNLRSQSHQLFCGQGGVYMLFSLALIMFCGFALGGVMKKLHLPSLIGMILTGILLGPYVLNIISSSILSISSDLREIALIIILIRAGLSLDIQDLKKVGRPAVLMCFIPATFEVAAVIIFAPMFFNISYLDAAIMGSVLAAVSPAVIVPRMLQLMENGYGEKKSIPQLILAGASVDDIYVIVLFTSFIGMTQGQGFSSISLIRIPLSILLGAALGLLAGTLMVWLFKKIHMRDTVKVLLLLGISFLFVSLETAVKDYVPISGLLAVMALGITILKQYEVLAKRISGKYEKLWVGAELLLFALVGAAVDIRYLTGAGIMAIALILIALVFRIAGVFVCLLKTRLNKKERMFCAIAYLPKATVQAAIGGVPLSIGLNSGDLILTVAVLAILITAPIGAIGIDRTYKRLLNKEKDALDVPKK